MKKGRSCIWIDLLLGIGAMLCIVFLFVSGILDHEYVFENLQNNGMRFEEGMFYSLERGDTYGSRNDGPFLMLPKGVYRLKWQLDGDGSNVIRIGTSNAARVVPDRFETTPDEWQGEAMFELLDDVHRFNIYVDFTSGTWMELYDLRLYTPEYRDRTFTVSFVIAGVYLLFLLYQHRFFTRDRIRDLAVIGIVLIVVSSPFMRDYYMVRDDMRFHASRILNLADGIRSGQIPVRVGGFSYHGYGAATSVFYPDLFLYPFALMSIAGASLTYVMNMCSIGINVLAAVTMMFCARHMFGREYASCATVLYLCAPYRLINVFQRGAIGEALAMAVFPLFILGLWEVIWKDQKKWPLLSVGAVAILMTHMLSVIIAGGIAVAAGICCLPRILREKRITAILKSLCLAILLGAFYLAPLLTYSIQGIGAQAIQGKCSDYMLDLADLFARWNVGELLLAGMAAAMIVVGDDAENKKALCLCLAAGIVCALMTTRHFPWGYASVITRGLSDYLQFPWRLLGITALMLSLVGGYGFMRISGSHKREMLVLVLVAALIGVMPAVEKNESSDRENIDAGEIVTPFTEYREYLMPGTDEGDILSRDIQYQGIIEITEYEKKGTQIRAKVNAKEDSILMIPLFGFDGYCVELNGDEVPWTLGENNRLTVQIPAGVEGTLCVQYVGKQLWHVTDGISLLTILGLCVYMIKKRKVNLKDEENSF